MGRPRKYFTILRRGEVLGRFSRTEISEGLRSRKFLAGDRFKDPTDSSWKPLLQLTDKVTSRGHKKVGSTRLRSKPLTRAKKAPLVNPKTTYRVMSKGTQLPGRYTRVWIARKLDAGQLTLADFYLDTDNQKWVKLTKDFLFKGSKASRQRYRRRALGRALGLDGPLQREIDKQVEVIFNSASEYHAEQIMYSGRDFACTTCFEIAGGSTIGNYHNGSCPICGGNRFSPLG